ncbi:extracellular glycosyl hydrolase family 78 protein [Xylariaceae sp. FL0804]|nr:extracellular glycosyl hydrolase family 78 protein [Xylariaceae sp. FL0804]
MGYVRGFASVRAAFALSTWEGILYDDAQAACQLRSVTQPQAHLTAGYPTYQQSQEPGGPAQVLISDVTFEHHRNALGIGEAAPRISWRFEGDATNWTQHGYSIEVTRSLPDDPRSEHEQVYTFSGSDSVLVPWPDRPLSSAESAVVRVRAYQSVQVPPGEALPPTPWSAAVTVEAGLLTREDWSGTKMIAAEPATEVGATHQPILLRKAFAVGEVQSARLYITAFGMYEAHINGKRVGDAVLAPGWQSYNHRLVYDTYDVTDLLRTGGNAIGIQVGEGWYAGRLGFSGTARDRNNWGDTLGAMARLVITELDFSKHTISTDLTWESSTGAVIRSEIYDGEYYDCAREQPGWTTPEFKVPGHAKWVGVRELETPRRRLVSPDGPPIRRIQEVKLKKVLTSPSGKTILDFGQNLVGWLRVKVANTSASVIKMVHTEVLENGEVATRPLRTATQTDYLSLLWLGGFLTWEPKFTFHGFRYVMIEDWPTDTPLNENAVTAIVVHSDMEQTGEFECSHGLLNKLIQNVRWSMKGNFVSVPTDCPQRDERLGWSADAQVFCPTANFLYNTTGFWRGWLRLLRVWGDAIVFIPSATYATSGDLVALQDQFVAAKAWIDHGIPRNEAGLWDHSYFQYGDWLDPLAPSDKPGAATTDSAYVSDAYLVHATSQLATMAEALGYDADSERYKDQVRDLKAAFQEAWISDDGMVAYETQTGLVLALFFDLFPDAGQRDAAAARLDGIIAANKYLVGTGFAGTYLLGPTLTKCGLTPSFYKMLLQTAVPSWLYQVAMGATTTWERWDSLLPDGSLNPGQMTSFNHYAFGSVASWVFGTVGGLAPASAEPGWKTARVAVEPGGGIAWAGASYLSPRGRFATEWQVDDDGFHLTLRVPPNASADVVLPQCGGATTKVGSGIHRFDVPGFRMESM